MIMKIDAIVREEKFEDVKNALMEIEVNGLTVYRPYLLSSPSGSS